MWQTYAEIRDIGGAITSPRAAAIARSIEHLISGSCDCGSIKQPRAATTAGQRDLDDVVVSGQVSSAAIGLPLARRIRLATPDGLIPVISNGQFARFMPHEWDIDANRNPSPPIQWRPAPGPFALVEIERNCRFKLVLGDVSDASQGAVYQAFKSEFGEHQRKFMHHLSELPSPHFRTVYNPLLCVPQQPGEAVDVVVSRLYAELVEHLNSDAWRRARSLIAALLPTLTPKYPRPRPT